MEPQRFDLKFMRWNKELSTHEHDNVCNPPRLKIFGIN